MQDANYLAKNGFKNTHFKQKSVQKQEIKPKELGLIARSAQKSNLKAENVTMKPRDNSKDWA